MLFLPLAPIAPAEEAFQKTTLWNDLAFPRLDEEECPEGITGIPESPAILVKFDSVMKVWRTPSCKQESHIFLKYALISGNSLKKSCTQV
jgi:hypothetical protein